MKKTLKVVGLIFLFACLMGCGNAVEQPERDELYISAAISLSDVLEEVKVLFEAEHDVTLTYQFGGSGKLAQQIRQGSPGDVFISANEQWMDMLMEQNLIDIDTYTPVISNRLVLVKEKDQFMLIENLTALTSPTVKQIAIGHPESVPAGQYAQMALHRSGLWSELEAKTILAQDVSQVLTYVETGNAEVGFVYESDADDSDGVEMIAYIEPFLYDEVIYPGGVRTDSSQAELAKDFLQFLTSEQVQKLFKAHGFSELSGGDLNE